MHALRASFPGACAAAGGDPHWAEPQGGVDGWAAPPEAPIPRLKCLLPTYMSSCGNTAERNQPNKQQQHGPLTWGPSVLHVFFPLLFWFYPQQPVFPCYNLFSTLMLYTRLFFPNSLFMQIISVAFLYLFSWYLPSLLLPNLISGLPFVYSAHWLGSVFTQSSVYAVPFVSLLALLSISLIIIKIGNWWSQSQFHCWITSSNSASVIFARFVPEMSFPTSCFSFLLTLNGFVVVSSYKSMLHVIAGSAAESKESVAVVKVCVCLCPYRIKALDLNLSLSRALYYLFCNVYSTAYCLLL